MKQLTPYPATDGMRFVTERLIAKRIAEEAGISGQIVSSGMIHNKVNGNPYYYTELNVQRLNTAIAKISGLLLRTTITLDETTPRQFQDLFLIINRNYLINQRMEKNRNWISNRVYNTKVKFKQEEIDKINEEINKIAEEVSNVLLVSDIPQ